MYANEDEKRRLTILKDQMDKGLFDHNIFTPKEVVVEMAECNEYQWHADETFLVMHNLEIAIVLQETYGIQPEQISFYTPDEIKRQYAEKMGYTNITELGEDMHFNEVLMNPPYQKMFGEKRSAKNHNLWSEFILNAMQISDRVSAIIPDGWMSTGSPVYTKMREFGIETVNVHECGRHFPGVGAKFTYVILDRSHTGETHIVTEDSEFNLVMPNIITPNPEHWEILAKLIADDDKQGWDMGRGYHATTTKHLFVDEAEDTHPVFHTNRQTFHAKDWRGDTKLKKVFSTTSGYYIPHYDNGTTGLAQNTIAVEVDNLKNAKTVFSSTLYTFIGRSLAKQQGWVSTRLFKELGRVDLSRPWTDEELYRRFKLNRKEVKLIEAEVSNING